MFKYITKRLVSLIPVVFIISVILFGMFKMMPGDPIAAMVPPGLKPEETQQWVIDKKEQYGLDKSIPEQYVRWISSTLSGDLGESIQFSRPVSDVIKEPLKNSIILNVVSIVISFLIAIPIGIRSAVKKGSSFDRFWQVFSLVGFSMPTFFIGMILIFIFAIRFRLFPIGGMPNSRDGFDLLMYSRYMFLPTITLTIGSLASTIRYVRNAMLEVLSQDYTRTARAKGLSTKVVIYRHAFRNALIPIVTLVASSLVTVFGGSVITETIFAWNGIGFVLMNALNNRDYMIVLAMNMFYAILGLVANLIMDLGYALVDPRVKLD